jgi:hypothetical protein
VNVKKLVRRLGVLSVSAIVFACSGSEERDVPVNPAGPSGGSATVTAPAATAPADDAQLDTLRPTLQVTNATSTPSGTRTYEFQIGDTPEFSSAAVLNVRNIPEGAGQTSLIVDTELIPVTRYYWRARAVQTGTTGPWSPTMRFRTRIQSFKSGNQVFDLLTDFNTVANDARGITYFGPSDPLPGAKLDDDDSYLSYRLTAPLPEGEVSFVARKVKGGGAADSSFIGETKVITMQDGGGSAGANPFRVFVEKFRTADAGVMKFTFASQGNAGSQQVSGGNGWDENVPYYFKLEWRGGTARIRVFNGTNETGGVKVDLSTSYTAPWNAANPVITIGSLDGDTMRDLRASNLYIGPYARPVSLGSASR